jgi:hypothetical protein
MKEEKIISNKIKKIVLLMFVNYGKLSKGGIRNGALDVIFSCGFISRSYLSNCLVVLLCKPNLFPAFDRGIGGLPATIWVIYNSSS